MNNSPDSSSSIGRKDLSGQLIVLLEDDELVRRATERLLRRFGAEVVAATGSRAALDQLSECARAPTCVIADYWLNREEDGIAAALAVQQATGNRVRALILTGDGSEKIHSRIAEAGFQLLRKPVNVEAFLQAIDLES